MLDFVLHSSVIIRRIGDGRRFFGARFNFVPWMQSLLKRNSGGGA